MCFNAYIVASAESFYVDAVTIEHCAMDTIQRFSACFIMFGSAVASPLGRIHYWKTGPKTNRRCCRVFVSVYNHFPDVFVLLVL